MPLLALRLATAALLVHAGGCAHTVTVETEPPGATVLLDGVELGPSPAEFTDEGSVQGKHTLVLRKEGYREQEVVLEEKLRADRFAASVFGGLLCIVPFLGVLWAWELPEERYQFTLEPDDSVPEEQQLRGRMLMGPPLPPGFRDTGGSR